MYFVACLFAECVPARQYGPLDSQEHIIQFSIRSIFADLWSQCPIHINCYLRDSMTPSTSSIHPTMKSASASVMHIGGLMRSTFP